MTSFKETLDAIKKSDEFKEFKKKNPKAEICGGFFILDYVSNDNKTSIDYLLGESVFSFTLKDSGKVYLDENRYDHLPDDPKFPKLIPIDPNISIELDDLKSIAGTKKLDEGISAKFNKIIAVLQSKDGKSIWNLTCMMEELIILNILIDAKTGEIIKFERKSMMDLIKRK
jgi:hypothetical protein